MLIFIIGFIVAWLLLSIFFYVREGAGGWSIWAHNWDTIIMMFPAIPVILLIEIIEEKIKNA